MVKASCDGCDELREELDAERARSAELEQEVARLRAECSGLHAQLAEAVKLTELQQADLKRYQQAYEASRPNHPERAPREQLQLAFERVLETLGATPPANDSDDTPEQEHEQADSPDSGKPRRKKRRHRHGRRQLNLESLPVLERRLEPEQIIGANAESYQHLTDEVSERVAWRPGEWVLLRIIRPKFIAVGTDSPAAESADGGETTATASAEPEDETSAGPDAGSGSAASPIEIVIAALPDNLWPNFMADTSAIAHVIVSKYGDILPLNRQEMISARSGFALPKATQCGWLKAAHNFCTPVVDAMFADGKQTAFLIATDATSARVLPARTKPADPPATQAWSPQRQRCENWHVYVFLADLDHVVFRYHREHNGRVFQELLRGYNGNLLADAASVFDVLYRDHGMTEHGCWFHCRRPFYRALETEPGQALEALSLIGKLFEVDRKLRDDNVDLETFTEQRAERARPILQLFDDWIALNEGRVDPRGRLASGIGYYKNQRTALHRFLDDGRVRLDNNLSEQALRNVALGQANWQFFANETGLGWYTTFRSLIASCVLHRLNPEIYIEQLLRIVPHWPKNRVLELAPKYWLKTLAGLEPRWRAMLERPWEPGVVAPSEIALRGSRDAATASSEHAA